MPETTETRRKELKEKIYTDGLYAQYLSVRSEPVQNFLSGASSKWQLPMTYACCLQPLPEKFASQAAQKASNLTHACATLRFLHQPFTVL